jgi:CAAX protease family protein
VTSTTPAAPGSGRPGIWLALGWTALFLIGGLVLMTVATILLLSAIGGFDRGRIMSLESNAWIPLGAQTAAGLAVFGALTWLIGIKALRLTPADLRWSGPGSGWRGFGRGLLIGVGAAIVTFLLSAALGGARLERDPGDGGIVAYLAGLGQLLLLLVPAALLEEVMFRGVPQVVMARAVGRWPALLLISIAFALAHVLNPNSTRLGLVNIGLAGILLGAAFYLPGGIWCAWGAHLRWNATLAGADAPVSGLPARLPFLDYAAGSPAWLTGGAFGPEGGFTASLALLGAAVVLVRWLQRERA